MIDILYSELILDLNRNPLNKKVPKSFDLSLKAKNSSCGDRLNFYFKLDSNFKIIEAFWDGEGCALSTASASLFSNLVKGKSLVQIKKMNPKTLLNVLGLKNLSPGRLKCALLPLESVK